MLRPYGSAWLPPTVAGCLLARASAAVDAGLAVRPTNGATGLPDRRVGGGGSPPPRAAPDGAAAFLAAAAVVVAAAIGALAYTAGQPEKESDPADDGPL
ncbi:hypothetical protein [Streptomyces amritsarensis]|uniref:hypothetical protein n=1 Tax=Streptomyces amritsarensis TaxID=681158 RepID=UPI00117C0C12|nr:hypothetical protein [Streptomyces amritsarensis]